MFEPTVIGFTPPVTCRESGVKVKVYVFGVFAFAAIVAQVTVV